MTAAEIRNTFVEFFKSKNHAFVSSSSLIPYEDPSLMFINAGMNQFKNIFLGLEKTKTPRVANYQKCLRVSGKHNDLEDVGVDTYHHTFFEMLGNWSFGDYYKKEAIQWAWELFTQVFKLPKEKLYATIYHSDDEAGELWKTLTDINPEHILKFGDKDNFWEMGETGPCGPCSEIHIDLGPDACDKQGVKNHECQVNGDCGRYIELWNLVFIQYNRNSKKELEPLKEKHVDTGAGLERLVCVLQGKKSNYDTDLFKPLIEILEEKSKKAYQGENSIAMRVIADHIRTLVFSIADGVIPSNEGRGYVIRRILRRAFRYGKLLGFKKPFLHLLVDKVVSIMGEAYPEIKENQKKVQNTILHEEERFAETLDRGLDLFEKVVSFLKSANFPGKEAFTLYDTYGFPMDLTRLLCKERNLSLNETEFEAEMEKQKEKARGASSFKGIEDISWTLNHEESPLFVGYDVLETQSKVIKYSLLPQNEIRLVISPNPFYAESGGQVGDTGQVFGKNFTLQVEDTQKVGEDSVLFGKYEGNFSPKEILNAQVDKEKRIATQKNHTATHLLHKALQLVLGDHVQQAGSLVDSSKLRFDFAHFGKMSFQEIHQVEEIVNQEIQKAQNLNVGIYSLEEAKKMGAAALFGEKYGEKVRVVGVPQYSLEFCGGAHVKNTGEIGVFKITSESSAASGIRRIEAITGKTALKELFRRYEILASVKRNFNIVALELENRLKDLTKENKDLKKGGTNLKKIEKPKLTFNMVKEIKFYTQILEEIPNPAFLKELNDDVKSLQKNYVAVFLGKHNGTYQYVVGVGEETLSFIKAGDIAGFINENLQGKGGGRPLLAQGSIAEDENSKIEAVFKEIEKKLENCG